MPDPQISIIVPTHNRKDLLARLLEALECQERGTPPFEVIVVADGCVDNTVTWCRNYRGSFPVRAVETPGRGPAVARNRGVKLARAPLLLFLDDDVMPSPALVRAHLNAHLQYPGSAVIGPYPPWPYPGRDMFRSRIRAAWLRHFDGLRQPGHRFGFRDLLTGNLSLAHGLWNEVGGLDPTFAFAREDHELGVRLIARGVPIHYCDAAFAWHHEHLTSSLKSALRRARDEGKSDALLALKHPHLREMLPVSRTAMRSRNRLVRTLLLGRKGAGAQWACELGAPVLKMLEWAGLRRLYTRVFNALHSLAYHRAAGAALKGHWWKIFPQDGPIQPELSIDLADGLERAEQELDRYRPSTVLICFGGHKLAILPDVPGYEPWAGRHLRQALFEHVPPYQLLAALDGRKCTTALVGSPPTLRHFFKPAALTHLRGKTARSGQAQGNTHDD